MNFIPNTDWMATSTAWLSWWKQSLWKEVRIRSQPLPFSLCIPTCKQLYMGTSYCCYWSHRELPSCIDDQDLEETISIIKEGTVRNMDHLHITCVIGTDVTWRDVVLNFQVSLFVYWIETSTAPDNLCLIANPLASLKYANIGNIRNAFQSCNKCLQPWYRRHPVHILFHSKTQHTLRDVEAGVW